MRGEKFNLQKAFDGLRSDYQAAKTGRFRRRRTGIAGTGSGADYHYRSESDYLRIMEYARDMDRNDGIVGQMINRAVLNAIQNGLQPDPKTGDEKLDQAIKDRWWDWAGDARKCSTDGEMTYSDMEELALRHVFVDGDIFAIHTEDGPLQLVEAHRCRTPSATKRNVVHGVLMDESRKRLEYWFTKDDIEPTRALKLVGEIEARPAFDEDGNRLVLHVRDPKRVTQTRGVSALAPVFDMLGMHEDIQFAKLVQQQITSCITFIRQRTSDFNGGTPESLGRTEVDAAERLITDIAPGLEIRGLKGETITGFSPNVPNAEFFQQMRMILQIIGNNLGLPLVLLMMDASDTNFSGWRGAMDQAKMGFRRNQRWFIDHFETPNYLWKLRQFAVQDRAMLAAMNRLGPKFFAHEWNTPRWPYIQPLQDAQADELRQRKLLTSPRRMHAERSQDWQDVITETVADNQLAIVAAIETAKAIEKKYGVRIHWREVLFLTDVEMLKTIGGGAPSPSIEETQPAPKPQLPPGSENGGEHTGNDTEDDEDDTRDPEDREAEKPA